MSDKKLLDLVENFLVGLDDGELFDYLKSVDLKVNDVYKIALCFAKGKMWEYVDCNKIRDIIENIDNDDFMNDEYNLY